MGVTVEPVMRAGSDKVGFDDLQNGIFECPITKITASGGYRFVVMKDCGCVFTERALKMVKQDLSTCVSCGKQVSAKRDAFHVIVLNQTVEEQDVIRKQIDAKHAKRMKKKSKKAKSKENKEDRPRKKQKKADKSADIVNSKMKESSTYAS